MKTYKNLVDISLILLRMRSFSENGAGYEIMWKNMVEPDRPQGTI
jgi:hypothetical protein